MSYISYDVPSPKCVTPQYSEDVGDFLLSISLNTTASTCISGNDMPLPDNYKSFKRLCNGKATLGYIFVPDDHNRPYVISFTGTSSIEEWIKDIEYKRIYPKALNNVTPDVLVHQGFYELYLSVRGEILNVVSNVKELYITGHSLGGALATICTLDMCSLVPKLGIYTFASPRCVNIIAAKILSDFVTTFKITTFQRIFNTEDIITTLPPAVLPNGGKYMEYIHVGRNVSFTINMGNSVKNHTHAYMIFYDIDFDD